MHGGSEVVVVGLAYGGGGVFVPEAVKGESKQSDDDEVDGPAKCRYSSKQSVQAVRWKFLLQKPKSWSSHLQRKRM
jgi:hypothetical protein